jgi:murein DD-endopeptidase MepM/ murein hydrolase activator NlpD
MDVPGYPKVYTMTLNHGSFRTGVFIVTKAKHPKIEGYRVRYMHLAAIRPGLSVGDTIEAGEEIGIMGATAIQVSAPHVHIDIEDENLVRVNPATYIGLDGLLSGNCRPINKRSWAKRRRYRRWLRRKRNRRR